MADGGKGRKEERKGGRGEGGREEERPKIREEGKKLREYNFTEEKEDRI